MQSSWLIPSLHLMSVREENRRSLWESNPGERASQANVLSIMPLTPLQIGVHFNHLKVRRWIIFNFDHSRLREKVGWKNISILENFPILAKKSIFQKDSTLTSPLIHYCLQLWQQLWIWISLQEDDHAHTLLGQHITWEGSVTNIKVPLGKTK